MDTEECVILQVDGRNILDEFDTGVYGWCGGAAKRWGGYHLGIYNKEWPTSIGSAGISTSKIGACSGWGFGNNCGVDNQTVCAWGGEIIPDTRFEISVKASELSPDDEPFLLAR